MRRKTTGDTVDSDAWALTCQQERAIMLLAGGKTLTDVALELQIGVPGVISGNFSVGEIATKSLLVARYDYI
jgi:hypothetical protein